MKNISCANPSTESTESTSPYRSFDQLFYTPRPQIISAGTQTRYTLQMGNWRLQVSLPLNDIQRLYERVAVCDWRLINGVPADAAKILAAADRFVAGGAA